MDDRLRAAFYKVNRINYSQSTIIGIELIAYSLCECATFLDIGGWIGDETGVFMIEGEVIRPRIAERSMS
jgi:hypothetical protein